MLMPNGVDGVDKYSGFETSAGAVMIGLNRVQDEGILPNTNFTFTWYFDQCDEALSIAYTARLIKQDQVDVIIGPTCSASIITSGIMARAYDFPVIVWGPMISGDLEDRDRFPSIVLNSANARDAVLALLSIMDEFDWYEFAFFYTARRSELVPTCSLIADAVSRVTNGQSEFNTSLIFKRNLNNDSYNSMRLQLLGMKTQARIIVGCFESNMDKRNFLLAAAENEMISDDYVYIYVENTREGFGLTPFWVDQFNDPPDGKDLIAKTAAENVLVMDAQPANASFGWFQQTILDNMHDWPFYCDDCPTSGNASFQASRLADAFYIYANALNKTIQEYGESAVHNGSLIAQNSPIDFIGYSGRVVIGDGGIRRTIYSIYALNAQREQQLYARVITQNSNTSLWTPLYTREAELWATRDGGMRPRSRPLCGFDGSGCPANFWQAYFVYVTVGSVGLILIATIIAALFVGIFRIRYLEQKRQNMLWQVPFAMLSRREKSEGSKSLHSIRSGISAATMSTVASKRDTEKTIFCFLSREPVVARRLERRVEYGKEHEAEFRYMQKRDHENLNKFIGLCLDGPHLYAIWRFCERGSVAEVIENNKSNLDAYIVTSLIKDICEGLYAIHSSPILKQHGDLNSVNCLVTDRWQVKIRDFGMNAFKSTFTRSKRDQRNLWVAPEILRVKQNMVGTKAGDVYSFGIICSELVTRKPAWNIGDIEHSQEQVLYKIRRGGSPPYRPELNDDGMMVNPALFQLVRDCWSEAPEKRPRIEAVREALRAIRSNSSKNLMDYIFTLLENNASTLEQEVEERTQELTQEKRKSDILLNRMLPRAVADRLKLGQTVEPELFESVTVFFSDIVSFTTLAGKSTPLQVVNLLNELYTEFDSIIDQHGVYKVETIGDGLHCVSGCPIRNDNEHVRDIAEMSFAFLRVLKAYRVPHLPDHQLQIRIGVHTGRCVAGVLGLTAPRYCVLGDSVNMSAKLEHSGKPGRIHISAETQRFIVANFGEHRYRTESRGDTMIKGSGPVETYWLIPPEELGHSFADDL
ncbi:guanylyl cyclase [Aphelenchoides avenae]|nr:guanylyl cyclase [Aphelenchus avenae]